MEDVFLLCARSRRDSVAYCSGSGTSILRMKERCKKSLLVSAIVLGLLVFHKCSADGEPSSSDRDPMPFTRRKLLVLDQILGGGDRNYVSANDVLFAVLRANKCALKSSSSLLLSCMPR